MSRYKRNRIWRICIAMLVLTDFAFYTAKSRDALKPASWH